MITSGFCKIKNANHASISIIHREKKWSYSYQIKNYKKVYGRITRACLKKLESLIDIK